MAAPVVDPAPHDFFPLDGGGRRVLGTAPTPGSSTGLPPAPVPASLQLWHPIPMTGSFPSLGILAPSPAFGSSDSLPPASAPLFYSLLPALASRLLHQPLAPLPPSLQLCHPAIPAGSSLGRHLGVALFPPYKHAWFGSWPHIPWADVVLTLTSRGFFADQVIKWETQILHAGMGTV